MQGFITESASKITDGLGSTLKLLTVAAATSLLFMPVNQADNPILKTAYIGMLLLGGVYFLYRSLVPAASDAVRASNGMLSGLLLFQVLRFSGLTQKWGLLDTRGYLIWLVAVLVVGLLWRRAFPTGVRFLVLLVLLNWLGSLYSASGASAADWGQAWQIGFKSLRYLGAAGIAVTLWFILLKSGNALQRKYGAALLYFFVLFTFLFF
ncbi:MAG TPA: hypothetical protein PK040_07375 [Anaerolineaceae bacterium]|nr:hypothetical protein [Anaerolineaceae bacterium]